MNLKKKVAHQPFSCELEGATTAVIFIHGILEGPYQFHGLAEKILDQGMSSFGIYSLDMVAVHESLLKVIVSSG